MNRNNNILNKNEIENKLKGFQENKDYSISPTEDPEKETYVFYNDELRSIFSSNGVPFRVTREKYDGQDYKYQGHFEEGKDYNYSAQQWHYGENYQRNRGTDAENTISNIFKLRGDVVRTIGIGEGDWRSSSHIEVFGKAGNFHTGETYWEGKWNYRGKGNLNGNPEQKRIEPSNSLFWNNEQRINDLEAKSNEWKKKLNYLERQPKSGEAEVAILKKDIKDAENTISNLKNNDDNDNKQSNLVKENQELKQQLSKVQKQLTEVLAELKKLKSNVTGDEGAEELDQQIAQNERLIKSSEGASVTEVKEQVNKSQALMKKFNSVSSTEDNKAGNGSFPYVVGVSVILVSAGIVGYFLLKKNRGKKVA